MRHNSTSFQKDSHIFAKAIEDSANLK